VRPALAQPCHDGVLATAWRDVYTARSWHCRGPGPELRLNTALPAQRTLSERSYAHTTRCEILPQNMAGPLDTVGILGE
jgi:hypothetical protein